MKIKIADYKWKPRHLNELKRLKERIACFLKEQAAAKRYKIDGKLENEAEKWFKESKFPINYLKKAEKNSIVILRDEIGFPFEMLMADGAFLGQTYNITRKTRSPYQANQNFKICYQFEENDEAYQYYEYIENTFPVELLEPVSGNISANVFHVSGHFEKEEKEKIITRPMQKNVLLFFNSCCSFEYRNREQIKQLGHCVLSYFDIPVENLQCAEDFPYFFYQYLLEGYPLAAAFLEARRKYIDHTGLLTPLLFTLFTSCPDAHIFYTPYANHHKATEKEIKHMEKDIKQIKDNLKYPLFLFECQRGRQETIQSILNAAGRDIWVQGQKAGIGKTTLLYQVFQLFKYGKFNGPVFISFKDHRGLKDLRLKNLGEYLCQYLEINNHPKKLSRNGKKYLVLVDAVESNPFLYHHFGSFVDELKEIFGSCRIIAVSRESCPVEDFLELQMEITAGDTNARRLRASYSIDTNIKLPDIPLVYKLFSRIRDRSPHHLGMNKSQIFEEFIQHYQEKTVEDKPFDVVPETFQRYLAILAHCQLENRDVTKKQFIEALRQFKQDHNHEMDWWLYDKERKNYRDAESICGFLLDTNIIVNDHDFLHFIHDSFYEYLLAYYFYWQGMDEADDKISQLMYGEVPDYMNELMRPGIYTGNHPADYLCLVFDRLFYIRDYQRIEAILHREENQQFIKSSDQLWYCLVKGCYFARNPEKHIDEIRSFQIVNEFTGPASLFNREKLKETSGKALREVCFTLLNILFDNNLLEEFFRLAVFLEDTCPTLEIYGLLSRGYLKINQIDKSFEYLKLKEREIHSHPGNEKHAIRLHAEKGLLYYYKYLAFRNHDDFDRGIIELTKAENYYQRDKQEEGNYLFTLREFLRYYLAGKKPGEFARVMQRINKIGSRDHPKTDYIPYLQGMAAIQLEENIDTGIKRLLEGAAGFYENQLLFESAVACLWAYYYCSDSQEKTDYFMEAVYIFKELEDKRNKIKKYWAP
ncbi:MAG: hypothetical protein JSV88_12120, partial [Candidatus Aminicenantes bacterium]